MEKGTSGVQRTIEKKTTSKPPSHTDILCPPTSRHTSAAWFRIVMSLEHVLNKAT